MVKAIFQVLLVLNKQVFEIKINYIILYFMFQIGKKTGCNINKQKYKYNN